LRRLARATLEDFERIGRDIRLQQVGGVQLAQELDHFILRWRVFTQLALGKSPQVGHATLAVHAGQQQARARREAMHPPIGRVLQQVPDRPAVAVPVQLGARQQLRPQCGHAVPEAAVQRGGGHWSTPLAAYRDRAFGAVGPGFERPGAAALRAQFTASSPTAPGAANR
jgi:hypothetical protein